MYGYLDPFSLFLPTEVNIPAIWSTLRELKEEDLKPPPKKNISKIMSQKYLFGFLNTKYPKCICQTLR